MAAAPDDTKGYRITMVGGSKSSGAGHASRYYVYLKCFQPSFGKPKVFFCSRLTSDVSYFPPGSEAGLTCSSNNGSVSQFPYPTKGGFGVSAGEW